MQAIVKILQYCHGEGNGYPPVLLPGKSHGWRSLVGCSPWGRKESEKTERLHFHSSVSCMGEGNGTHSSVLAWRIPGTGEPGGLPSVGSHKSRTRLKRLSTEHREEESGFFYLGRLVFSSVQSLSRVWLFATPWIAARQASLSITNSQSLLRLMPIESMMPSSRLILCRPLLLLPSVIGFSEV